MSLGVKFCCLGQIVVGRVAAVTLRSMSWSKLAKPGKSMSRQKSFPALPLQFFSIHIKGMLALRHQPQYNQAVDHSRIPMRAGASILRHQRGLRCKSSSESSSTPAGPPNPRKPLQTYQSPDQSRCMRAAAQAGHHQQTQG